MAGGDQGAGEQGQQDSCARHPAALLLPAPQHPSKLGTPLAFRPLHSAPSAFARLPAKLMPARKARLWLTAGGAHVAHRSQLAGSRAPREDTS
jgi:hypothetical protein